MFVDKRAHMREYFNKIYPNEKLGFDKVIILTSKLYVNNSQNN